MKINHKKFCDANAVCEEFSRHVFSDKEHCSFIINVDVEWVDTLIERMNKIGFKIVAKIEMEKTITLVFQHSAFKIA